MKKPTQFVSENPEIEIGVDSFSYALTNMEKDDIGETFIAPERLQNIFEEEKLETEITIHPCGGYDRTKHFFRGNFSTEPHNCDYNVFRKKIQDIRTLLYVKHYIKMKASSIEFNINFQTKNDIFKNNIVFLDLKEALENLLPKIQQKREVNMTIKKKGYCQEEYLDAFLENNKIAKRDRLVWSGVTFTVLSSNSSYFSLKFYDKTREAELDKPTGEMEKVYQKLADMDQEYIQTEENGNDRKKRLKSWKKENISNYLLTEKRWMRLEITIHSRGIPQFFCLDHNNGQYIEPENIQRIRQLFHLLKTELKEIKSTNIMTKEIIWALDIASKNYSAI